MFGKIKGDKIVFDEEKGIVFIEFMGARSDLDEDDGMIDYAPRGKIAIRLDDIMAFYDHTIVTKGKRITVMDTYEEIKKKICRIY